MTTARWHLRYRILALLVALATVPGLMLTRGLTPAQALITQSAPFPVGNMLNYQNSDFENGVGNWAPDTSQTNNIGTFTTDTVSMEHSHSLKVVAASNASAATMIYKLGNGSTNAVQINLPKTGAEYRVGAYFKGPNSVNQHNIEFDLGCYDLKGTWLGWSLGSQVALNTSGNWQYVEDDITVPSTCAQVQGSPRVQATNFNANGILHMDYAIFAPFRAAIAVGAHGECANPCTVGTGTQYSASDWLSTNTAIGPSQADKEFFSGGLPSTTQGGKTPFEQTNCSDIEQGLPAGQPYPVCILAYKGAMTQQDMNNFLVSVPPGQQVYLVYWQEPEGSYPGTAQQFVSDFQANAQLVHTSPDDSPNIFVAENSAGSPYESDPTVQNCSWIVPASSTNGPDVYLMDHYENGTVNGNNVNGSVNATEWQDWLKCASAQNRPLGFGEYGLDDSYEANQNQPIPPCDQNQPTTNAQNLPNALVADREYLAHLPMSGDVNLLNPAPFVVWAYWYSYWGGTPVCTVFGNTNLAINKWQFIENQNGGPVGG